ncbi:MAG TPA: cytochrome c [Panacibacter sp.]|nr:cytochrome c [Panacibacter sp.]HNP46155.1 cytochrome c [Panacibacter sp.]
MKQKQNLFSATAITASLLFCSFAGQTFDLKASMERGKELYVTNCQSCHMEEGQGLEGVYPPLAKSDYLMADKKRSIKQTLYGATGEITVNGAAYNTDMTGYDLTDQETSDVLNFIRNSWGNKGEPVLPADVKAERKPAQ